MGFAHREMRGRPKNHKAGIESPKKYKEKKRDAAEGRQELDTTVAVLPQALSEEAEVSFRTVSQAGLVKRPAVIPTERAHSSHNSNSVVVSLSQWVLQQMRQH